jgi:predicted nucleotidyltransferase
MYEQELQEAVRESLADLPNVNLVYLFGSRVDGWVGPRSDYDLGVVLDRVQDAPQSCMQLCADLRRILGSVHIDMVVLNKAPIELAYAVIAQGKVLYQRDVTTRVEYEAEVMSRYGDYLPVLRAQRQDILQ